MYFAVKFGDRWFCAPPFSTFLNHLSEKLFSFRLSSGFSDGAQFSFRLSSKSFSMSCC